MNWAVVIYMCVRLVNVLTSSFSALIALSSPFQVIACVYWWFWGYKSFRGPCPNLDPEVRAKIGKPLTDLVRPPMPGIAGSSESPQEKEAKPVGI